MPLFPCFPFFLLHNDSIVIIKLDSNTIANLLLTNVILLVVGKSSQIYLPSRVHHQKSMWTMGFFVWVGISLYNRYFDNLTSFKQWNADFQ